MDKRIIKNLRFALITAICGISLETLIAIIANLFRG